MAQCFAPENFKDPTEKEISPVRDINALVDIDLART
jgi:hypothetical protein